MGAHTKNENVRKRRTHTDACGGDGRTDSFGTDGRHVRTETALRSLQLSHSMRTPLSSLSISPFCHTHSHKWWWPLVTDFLIFLALFSILIYISGIFLCLVFHIVSKNETPLFFSSRHTHPALSLSHLSFSFEEQQDECKIIPSLQPRFLSLGADVPPLLVDSLSGMPKEASYEALERRLATLALTDLWDAYPNKQAYLVLLRDNVAVNTTALASLLDSHNITLWWAPSTTQSYQGISSVFMSGDVAAHVMHRARLMACLGEFEDAYRNKRTGMFGDAPYTGVEFLEQCVAGHFQFDVQRAHEHLFAQAQDKDSMSSLLEAHTRLQG